VEVRWSDFGLWQGAGRTGRPAVAVQERQQVMEALTDAEGRYRACGVPAERLLVVQASFLDRKGDTVHVRAREDAYAVLDLEVPLPPGLLTSRTEARVVGRGRGGPGSAGVGAGEGIREPGPICRGDPAPGPGTRGGEGNHRRPGLLSPAHARWPGAYSVTASGPGIRVASSEEVAVEPGN
jgi:hypothetical protein